MYRKIRNGAIAVAVAVAGISAAASADASSASASAPATAAVAIVGDAHGLTLRSEHANPDGSITSTWKNSAGQGFTYAGPVGAHFTVSPAVTTVAGKTVHSMSITVAQPAHGNLAAAAAAYARSGQSVLKDALNAGVKPALAEAKFGAGAKHVVADTARPNATSGNTILRTWCVNQVNYNDISATGCVTEYLVQSGSPEYVSDDMEGLAWSNLSGFDFTGFQIYSDYTGTVVPPWVPNGSQGTNCNDVTASASFAGFSFSSTSTICGGSYVTKLASNTFGMHWSGDSYGQVGLEPIDVVKCNGNDGAYTTITIWTP